METDVHTNTFVPLRRSLLRTACLGLAVLFMPHSTQGGVAAPPPVREDSFTTLFPLDAAALANATTTAEALAVVAQTLPHLGDVMGAPALERVLELATQGNALGGQATDGNPLADSDTAGRTRSVTHAQWFVVGMRLSPCTNPTWIPNAWLRAVADLERAVCVPQVRIVAQAFGVRREEDPQMGVFRSMGSSDDKTLHLVFDALPEFDTAAVASLRSTEAKLEGALGARMTATELTERLTAVLTAPKALRTRERLEKARADFLQKVRGLPPTSQGAGTLAELVRDALDAPHALAERQAPLRRALRTTLLDGARLRHVTLNFSNSGAAARPGSSWVFAKLSPSGTGEKQFPLATVLKAPDKASFNALVALEKTPLVAPAWETKQADNEMLHGLSLPNAGLHETFLPVPGRPASVDAELLAAARGDAFTARALSFGGFFPFFAGNEATSSDALESDRARGVSGAAARTLAVVASGLFSPAVQGPSSTSCASCHAATGARTRYLGDTWPVAAPKANRFRDDTTRLNFGHATFNEMWNLRMLGYFERAPSIADRVVLETLDDLRHSQDM